MKTTLPFKMIVKRAAWFTEIERWAFYHVTNEEEPIIDGGPNLIYCREIDGMHTLTRAEQNTLGKDVIEMSKTGWSRETFLSGI